MDTCQSTIQAQRFAQHVSIEAEEEIKKNQVREIISRLRNNASEWRRNNNIILSSFAHKCESSCPFFSHGNILVCGLTNIVHMCGKECDRQVLTNEAYCCSLTGMVITTEFRMSNPIQKSVYEDARHFVLRRKPRSKVRRSSELDTDGIRSTIVKTLELIFGQLKRQQIRQVALQRFKKECVRFSKRSNSFTQQSLAFRKLINSHFRMLRMWPSNLHFIQPLASDIFSFLDCIPVDRTSKRIKVYTAVLIDLLGNEQDFELCGRVFVKASPFIRAHGLALIQYPLLGIQSRQMTSAIRELKNLLLCAGQPRPIQPLIHTLETPT